MRIVWILSRTAPHPEQRQGAAEARVEGRCAARAKCDCGSWWLLAVAGTVARGRGAAGRLAGGAVRHRVGGGRRGAGDAMPLEFLELGHHRVARCDELRVALIGQSAQQKECSEAVE